MMYYTVGEMAKRLGVAPSTLRYYDQEGLLPFVERSEGGIRVFKESDYEWLLVIGCLKKTGMQLRDIKTFIEMAMQGDQTIEPRLALITKQVYVSLFFGVFVGGMFLAGGNPIEAIGTVYTVMSEKVGGNVSIH